MKNTIYSINGPVVTIKGKTDLEMMEMVYVGKARLVGEVIRMNDKETRLQSLEKARELVLPLYRQGALKPELLGWRKALACRLFFNGHFTLARLFV